MNKYLKLVLTGLLITGGIYAITEREVGLGVFLILLSILPLVFFVRNEFILLSFWFLRKQELPTANKWINKINNPESQLIKQQMGYFYYMKGLTQGQEKVSETEKMMKKALKHGLTFSHDRAMANLNLAGVAMSKGKKKEAEIHLKAAKKDDEQGMLTEQIKEMRSQMKKFNVGNNMHNPQTRKGKYM